MNQICDLGGMLSPAHRRMVADNIRSIAEASFSPTVWMRAIYADETPIGFIMTHTGSDYEKGMDCPGLFLWSFMLGSPWQGKGYGRQALDELIQQLKAMGIPLLYTSFGQGEGSPKALIANWALSPLAEPTVKTMMRLS